jgi:hypothetical protein
MKRIILFCLAAVLGMSGFAQSEKYTAAMKANLSALDTSFKNPANLLAMANNFERIASAEKNQWLPYYYAAYCQVNYGFFEQDKTKVDAIANKAGELISKADALNPNNSEISCIKSMIATCHLMVNPMQRYMEYGQESADHMDAAIKQDPSNPRPYLLKGQNLKFTPAEFGGGCSTAKPELQTALDKFAAFKPASELHPNWGKARVEDLMKDCK